MGLEWGLEWGLWLIDIDALSSVDACGVRGPRSVWVTYFQVLFLDRDEERYFHPVSLFLSTYLERIREFFSFVKTLWRELGTHTIQSLILDHWNYKWIYYLPTLGILATDRIQRI